MSKATWTDADFARMGWHDCPVHAICVGVYDDATLPPARLLLDLDYIVRWVDPAGSGQPFSFWISPATLVFAQAWKITGELGPLHDVMEIAELHRLASPDGEPDHEWHIEGQNFDVRLRAHGYTQYLRQPPRKVGKQVLTMAERGGPSFAEQSFV